MIKENLTLEEYHQLEPKSAHFLMDVDDDPETAVYDKENPEEPSTTVQKRLDLGTHIHTGIEVKTEENFAKFYHLEPEKRNEILLRSAETGRLTKAGKLQLEELKKEVAPKIVITQEVWEVVAGCREAAWSNIYARPYLKAAKFERSGFTNINGVEVKARPDLDCYEKQRTLVDIKTRQKKAANKEKWLKDWWNNKTYIQSGLQLLVWEKLNMPCSHYYYLLVEIKKPHKVRLVYLDDELMEISKERTLDAIEKWKSWIGAGSPKGYGQPQEMQAKPWYRNHELTL